MFPMQRGKRKQKQLYTLFPLTVKVIFVTTYEVSTTISIIQKLRLREIKELARDHRAPE